MVHLELFHKDCIKKDAANHFDATSNTSCLSLGPGLGLGETNGEAVTKSVMPPIRVALSEVEYTPGYNWQIV